MQLKALQQIMELFRTTRNLTDKPFHFVSVKTGENLVAKGGNLTAFANQVRTDLTIAACAEPVTSAWLLPDPDRTVSYIVTPEVRAEAQALGRETFDLFCGTCPILDRETGLQLGYCMVERL